MTDAELTEKCTALASAGCDLSAAVLRVLAERDAARACVGALEWRVGVQSDLLGRWAECATQGEG